MQVMNDHNPRFGSQKVLRFQIDRLLPANQPLAATA